MLQYVHLYYAVSKLKKNENIETEYILEHICPSLYTIILYCDNYYIIFQPPVYGRTLIKQLKSCLYVYSFQHTLIACVLRWNIHFPVYARIVYAPMTTTSRSKCTQVIGRTLLSLVKLCVRNSYLLKKISISSVCVYFTLKNKQEKWSILCMYYFLIR